MSEHIEKMLKKRIVITGEGRVSRAIADYFHSQNQQNQITLLTHQDCRDGNVPECDYLIHAGAKVFADKSVKDPEAYLSSNVIDTFNLLEIVRKRPPKELFVYISTFEAIRPTSPYGATKAAGEGFTRAWGGTFGFNWLIVRLPNLFIPEWNDQGFVGKLLRCEIKEPKWPERKRQWLDGSVAAEWLWNEIQSTKNDVVNFTGVEYTDQQIVDRVDAYRTGAIKP